MFTAAKRILLASCSAELRGFAAKNSGTVEETVKSEWVSALDLEGRTIWIVDAHRGDGRRIIVRAEDKLSAFVELERQVLIVTFYLKSIYADPCVDQ